MFIPGQKRGLADASTWHACTRELEGGHNACCTVPSCVDPTTCVCYEDPGPLQYQPCPFIDRFSLSDAPYRIFICSLAVTRRTGRARFVFACVESCGRREAGGVVCPAAALVPAATRGVITTTSALHSLHHHSSFIRRRGDVARLDSEISEEKASDRQVRDLHAACCNPVWYHPSCWSLSGPWRVRGVVLVCSVVNW